MKNEWDQFFKWNKMSFNLSPVQSRWRCLSLLVGVATVAGLISPVAATYYCSNTFRFDQLCPDPRFGYHSQYSPVVSNQGQFPDTSIPLSSGGKRGDTSEGKSGVVTKDPSQTSCEFHRNGMESAVITAVHVTENPWSFRHSNACTHIFKLDYDLYNSDYPDGVYHPPSSGGRNSAADLNNRRNKVCQNEIGVRRFGTNDVATSNEDLAGNEELAKKMNVYFWHNFTLYSHSAQITDTITNYQFSKDDIACTTGSAAQYVQIAVAVSRGGKCEIIVQQYKIKEGRSRWGCSGMDYPIPYPIQFCGMYDCEQGTATVLTGLKLLSRRKVNYDDFTSQWNAHKTGAASNNDPGVSSGKQGSYRPAYYPKQHINQPPEGPDQKHTRPSLSYTDESEEELEEGEMPPCITTTPSPVVGNQVDEESEESEEESKEEDGEHKEVPIDWKEMMFLISFPICGIVLIFVVLNILRSQSARDICRVYSYPRPGYPQDSSTSTEKNSLPM